MQLKKTVSNYMREMGVRAVWVKKYRNHSTKRVHEKLHNILEQQFNPVKPNAVWCTDITYIWTAEGFVYLTNIMDLYSRKIIAWRVTKTVHISCVTDTVKLELKEKNMEGHALVIHSNRGSHFVSEEYKAITHAMTRSHSKIHYPYDNACIESFHSIIKREWLNRFPIKDQHQAKKLILDYIETFYNPKRIHRHNGNVSPSEREEFYTKNEIAQSAA